MPDDEQVEPDEPGEPVGPEHERDDTTDDGREPADEGPPPGNRRPIRSQLVVAVLLAALGFAAVTQVRTNEVDDTYSGVREQDLIDVLTGLAGTSQRAEDEIARLQRTRADLTDDSSRRQAALKEAQSQTDALEVLAGLVPVTGPGIRITITETTGAVQLDSLLDTIEELRTVGAEAIQVNGDVRVVAQTAFEAAPDGGFLVDGTQVGAPYVIDVIGEPTVLAGALDFALGPRQQLQEDGAELSVDQLSSLDIETVRKPTPSEFASPDGG